MPTDALSWEQIVERWPEYRPVLNGKVLIHSRKDDNWEWHHEASGNRTFFIEPSWVARALCQNQSAKLLGKQGVVCWQESDGWQCYGCGDLELQTEPVPDRDTCLRLAVQAVMETTDARTTA